MAYERETKLANRNFPDIESRTAFRCGYDDGYHGRSHDEHYDPPQPYNAGYWEGFADNPNNKPADGSEDGGDWMNGDM